MYDVVVVRNLTSRPNVRQQYSTKGVTILLITALLWTTSIHNEAVFHSVTSVSVSVSLSDYCVTDVISIAEERLEFWSP